MSIIGKQFLFYFFLVSGNAFEYGCLEADIGDLYERIHYNRVSN